MISKPSGETAEFWIIQKVVQCKNDLEFWRQNARTMTSEFEAETKLVEEMLERATNNLKAVRHGW